MGNIEKESHLELMQKYFKEGVEYKKKGSYQLAIAKFDKAIAEYKEMNENIKEVIELLGNSYICRGMCNSSLKNHTSAIADFTNAIGIQETAEVDDFDFDFSLLLAYNSRAILHRVLGNNDAAIADHHAELLISWKMYSGRTLFQSTYLHIGELLIKEACYEEAMAIFLKYNGPIWNVLKSCPKPENPNELDMRKKTLYSFVDKDKFLTDTLKGIDKNVDLYKDIYIQSLELVEILHIKALSSNSLHKQPEPEVAHYTTKIASEKMLFKNKKEASPMRLSSVATSNDPHEGLSLLACLALSNDNVELDYEAFITCFTFNHDCLNQFRLYGKDNNKEATGVSLVIDNEYFAHCLEALPASKRVSADEEELNDSDIPDKLPLYRCVYIDPETRKVVSVGHREPYTFYREKSVWSPMEIKNYEDEIAEVVEKFSVGFGNLKEEVDKLKKEIAEENKETQIVHEGILSKLLLHLRYLVKHVAFKEEQECRMITVEPLVQNPKIIVEDDKRMFIEHLPLATSVRHVYFAPNAPGYKLFQDRIKFEGLQFDCRISKSPLAKE